MLDPRNDLKEDHNLWEFVLACANEYKNKNIFGNLHGFRCAGSRLSVVDKNLNFKFPNEWDIQIRKEFREKYAIPYLREFRTIFRFVVENIPLLKKTSADILTRDVFLDRYLY